MAFHEKRQLCECGFLKLFSQSCLCPLLLGLHLTVRIEPLLGWQLGQGRRLLGTEGQRGAPAFHHGQGLMLACPRQFGTRRQVSPDALGHASRDPGGIRLGPARKEMRGRLSERQELRTDQLRCGVSLRGEVALETA
jgi:hypothetical protein